MAGQSLNAFNMFEDSELLSTRYESLKFNHESLKNDYASLETRVKIMEDWNDALRKHIEKNVREIERERKEGEQLKKSIEEMNLKNEKGAETLNILKEKCKILTEMLSDVHVAEAIFAQGVKEEVNVVEHKVATTVKVDDDHNANNVAFDKDVSEAAENQNANNNELDSLNGNNMAVDKDVSAAVQDPNANNNVIDTIVTSDDSDDILTDSIVNPHYYSSDETVTDTIGTNDNSNDAEHDPRQKTNTTPQRTVVEGCSNGATASKRRVQNPLAFLKRSQDEAQSSAELGLRRSPRTPKVNKKYEQ